MAEDTDKIKFVFSDSIWIEGAAVEQLKTTASLPNMLLGAGFPDLHPGKGGPVGAVFVSKDIFYPYIVGSDVGCGMAVAVGFSVAVGDGSPSTSGTSARYCGKPDTSATTSPMILKVWKVSLNKVGNGERFPNRAVPTPHKKISMVNFRFIEFTHCQGWQC